MDKKKAVMAVSLALFIFGAALVAYGAYYNSRLDVGFRPTATSTVPNNSTAMSINASINRTEQILNIANKSSYLIFYPNLAKPYSYLAKAQSIAKEDPGLAANLLQIAYNDTQEQIDYINGYRYDSLYVMLLLTAISAYALYKIITYKDKVPASRPRQPAKRNPQRQANPKSP
ncbi:hypothetical protein M1583_02895 [Candidatus Marsarchaeota archaeon]|nr:hypothetical protein [Candidatus Marsarchaeota archaeon]